MRKAVLILGVAVAAGLALVWALGGLASVERMAMAAQRDAQNALAGALRRLRTGDGAAIWALAGLSFGYGFFHAAGPGHGKVLIGAYGLGCRVGLGRLAGIAVASSLAQASVAVALVYAGIGVLGLTRDRLVDLGDGALTQASHAAVAALGLWLAWRGLRGLRRSHHGHDHRHASDCGCGHGHGPSVEAVAATRGGRDAAVLVGSVAVRPCTGALFVLILTWQMGIGSAGILSAYAMGIGTASVTLAVAGGAVWLREGALAALPGRRLALAMPMLELGVGALITAVATRSLIGAM